MFNWNDNKISKWAKRKYFMPLLIALVILIAISSGNYSIDNINVTINF